MKRVCHSKASIKIQKYSFRLCLSSSIEVVTKMRNSSEISATNHSFVKRKPKRENFSFLGFYFLSTLFWCISIRHSSFVCHAYINTQKFTVSPFLWDRLWITLVIIVLVIFVAVVVVVPVLLDFIIIIHTISFGFSHFCLPNTHTLFAVGWKSSSFYVILLFVESNTSSKCVPCTMYHPSYEFLQPYRI